MRQSSRAHERARDACVHTRNDRESLRGRWGGHASVSLSKRRGSMSTANAGDARAISALGPLRLATRSVAIGRIWFAAPQDGVLVVAMEIALRAEQIGVAEVHHGVELIQVVLDRGACGKGGRCVGGGR